MKKIDKLNLLLSSTAIVISIILSVIGYFWFVPAMREYQLRGRFEVSGKRLKPQDPRRPPDDSVDVAYEIDIHNIGSLPTKDIQIVARYPLMVTRDDQTGVYFFLDDEPKVVATDPPIPLETNEDSTQIMVRHALSPDAHLRIGFSVIPVTIWIRSEAGDTNIVQTGREPRMFWPPDMAEMYYKDQFKQTPPRQPRKRRSKTSKSN